MKAKQNLCVLYVAIILVSLGHTAYASESADPIRGRVIAGINLRAAPGLAGKVITGLEPGTVVTLTGEQSGWYQIAYEDEAYGYRGWVYGKYIEKLPGVSAAADRPAAAVEKLPPTRATAVEPESAPGQLSATGDATPRPVDMPTNTIELIQAAVVQKTAPAQAPAPPPLTAAETDGRVQAQAVKITPVEDIAATAGPGSTAGPGPGNLLSVVLKISSVFLSCLALMISYRTFHLVTASSRMS